MKKVYMPSMDKLYEMQELVGGNNLYNYLLIKTIETLIITGTNYQNRGIIKNEYNYIKENIDIVRSICYMYPDELRNLNPNIYRYDVLLCELLLNKEEDYSICKLDDLFRFSESVNYNHQIIKSVIDTLYEKLINYPQYRFEYLKSPLLESIFSVDTEKFEVFNEDIIKKLIAIEPSYALELPDKCYLWEGLKEHKLLFGLSEYEKRYRINPIVGAEYSGLNILTNPDTNVKRLIKTIKKDKDILY